MAVSKKFPGDILFFMVEQDFEFHPDRLGDESQGDAPHSQAGTEAWSSQASGSSAAGWSNRGTKRKDTKGELIIGEDSHATNLVKIVTSASRYNVGELFWLGPHPNFNKKEQCSGRQNFRST